LLAGAFVPDGTPEIVITFTAYWPWIAGSLAIILLVSGLDDLLPVLICAWKRIGNKGAGENACSTVTDERRIAIFIP